MRILLYAIVLSNLAVATIAQASETITYSYDALGRVVAVNHSGSVNNGIQANYSYDQAGNRTNVMVTGAASNSPPTRVIVVPLNGLTVIPIGTATL